MQNAIRERAWTRPFRTGPGAGGCNCRSSLASRGRTIALLSEFLARPKCADLDSTELSVELIRHPGCRPMSQAGADATTRTTRYRPKPVQRKRPRRPGISRAQPNASTRFVWITAPPLRISDAVAVELGD